MEPIFKNGQVVFVKKLDDCDHNDYGIFCITEDEITRIVFKRKILLKDGTYCLRSVNPDYKDIGESLLPRSCNLFSKLLQSIIIDYRPYGNNCSVDYLLGLTDVEKRATNKSNIIPIPIVKQK